MVDDISVKDDDDDDDGVIGNCNLNKISLAEKSARLIRSSIVNGYKQPKSLISSKANKLKKIINKS